MTTREFDQLSSFPLNEAFLCLDCQRIGNNSKACPNCASEALMNLAQVMNRKPEKEVTQ